MVDLVVLVVSVTSLTLVYDEWKNHCNHNFNAWAISIAGISFFSLLLNFFQFYLNKKMEDLSKSAEKNIGLVDSCPEMIQQT